MKIMFWQIQCVWRCCDYHQNRLCHHHDHDHDYDQNDNHRQIPAAARLIQCVWRCHAAEKSNNVATWKIHLRVRMMVVMATIMTIMMMIMMVQTENPDWSDSLRPFPQLERHDRLLVRPRSTNPQVFTKYWTFYPALPEYRATKSSVSWDILSSQLSTEMTHLMIKVIKVIKVFKTPSDVPINCVFIPRSRRRRSKCAGRSSSRFAFKQMWNKEKQQWRAANDPAARGVGGASRPRLLWQRPRSETGRSPRTWNWSRSRCLLFSLVHLLFPLDFILQQLLFDCAQ